MRIVPGVLALATVVALGGCAAATPAPPPATVTVATPAPSAPPPSSTVSSPTPDVSGPCRLDGLRAEVGTPRGGTAAGSTGTVDVVWTNVSSSICTLRGFGGADLQRSPAARSDLSSTERGRPDRFSLRRADEQAPAVRLGPGEKAHSTIEFRSGAQDLADFRADELLATPPDETRSAVLAWPRSASVLRDGATLGPVRAGAS